MLAMSDMSQMISAKQPTTHLWPSNQIDSSRRSAKHANKPTKTSKTHLNRQACKQTTKSSIWILHMSSKPSVCHVLWCEDLKIVRTSKLRGPMYKMRGPQKTIFYSKACHIQIHKLFCEWNIQIPDSILTAKRMVLCLNPRFETCFTRQIGR